MIVDLSSLITNKIQIDNYNEEDCGYVYVPYTSNLSMPLSFIEIITNKRKNINVKKIIDSNLEKIGVINATTTNI